jgi:hypothetical protein
VIGIEAVIVTYSLNRRIGLRGDLRYFRALVDESETDRIRATDYGFVRASVGVTSRFAADCTIAEPWPRLYALPVSVVDTSVVCPCTPNKEEPWHGDR